VNNKSGFSNITPNVETDTYANIIYKNIEKYKKNLTLFITKATSIKNKNIDKSITLRYNMD
jgi:hypothetical protein